MIGNDGRRDFHREDAFIGKNTAFHRPYAVEFHVLTAVYHEIAPDDVADSVQAGRWEMTSLLCDAYWKLKSDIRAGHHGTVLLSVCSPRLMKVG